MILSQIDKAVYDNKTKKYIITSSYFKDMKEILKEEYQELNFSLMTTTVYSKIESYYLNDGWETRYTKIMEN